MPVADSRLFQHKCRTLTSPKHYQSLGVGIIWPRLRWQGAKIHNGQAVDCSVEGTAQAPFPHTRAIQRAFRGGIQVLPTD